MTEGHGGHAAVPQEVPADLATPPGVARFDLLCHREVVETAVRLTDRWADDRALTGVDRERLVSLTHAAMTHGLRFEPSRMTLLIRWLDLDRVRLDLRWVGCSSTALPGTASRDVDATISTLDAIADEWGVGHSGSDWVHWIVAETC
ncbi:hypothetical protein [Nocardioides sp. YIM 152315]|uniref:hypothetical protein n=1 Tax=Nocardioides sp. YIM 152315 TaxID=3031760 RepID=UPI0023DB01DE|nr:hypothetical protein [Nocardioides sp. YIM 152315]MDF1605795.1 hypothetical protein [Nocardioides sp. YIM 152315]